MPSPKKPKVAKEEVQELDAVEQMIAEEAKEAEDIEIAFSASSAYASAEDIEVKFDNVKIIKTQPKEKPLPQIRQEKGYWYGYDKSGKLLIRAKNRDAVADAVKKFGG